MQANDQIVDWLKKRLQTLTECLVQLEESYKLIGSYRTRYLPVRNISNEHVFIARRVREAKIQEFRTFY